LGEVKKWKWGCDRNRRERIRRERSEKEEKSSLI